MFFNSTASRNVAVGQSALGLQSFDNGGVAWNSDNVAVGFEALYSNQPTSAFTGYDNTASGTQALRSNTTGSSNTASGFHALYSNTRGVSNTAVGAGALAANTGGVSSESFYNTAVGAGALSANTMGQQNIALGYDAGSGITSGAYNILIGNSGVSTDIYAIRIGSTPATLLLPVSAAPPQARPTLSRL